MVRFPFLITCKVIKVMRQCANCLNPSKTFLCTQCCVLKVVHKKQRYSFNSGRLWQLAHHFNENCLTVSNVDSKSKSDNCSSIGLIFNIQSQIVSCLGKAVFMGLKGLSHKSGPACEIRIGLTYLVQRWFQCAPNAAGRLTHSQDKIWEIHICLAIFFHSYAWAVNLCRS